MTRQNNTLDIGLEVEHMITLNAIKVNFITKKRSCFPTETWVLEHNVVIADKTTIVLKTRSKIKAIDLLVIIQIV